MKITGQGPANWNRIIESYNQNVRARVKNTSQKEDTIQISEEGRFFQEIKSILTKEEGMRVELVEAIRNRIENGQYDVSVSDLADAILKEMGQ